MVAGISLQQQDGEPGRQYSFARSSLPSGRPQKEAASRRRPGVRLVDEQNMPMGAPAMSTATCPAPVSEASVRGISNGAPGGHAALYITDKGFVRAPSNY